MFEEVLNHVLELLRKCNFGPLYFYSKWTKVAGWNSFKVIKSYNLTRDQNCWLFLEKFSLNLCSDRK